MRVLIRHKANVDKLTNAQNDKITPLMLAAQKGHLDIASLLIEHSAQVEMKGLYFVILLNKTINYFFKCRSNFRYSNFSLF